LVKFVGVEIVLLAPAISDCTKMTMMSPDRIDAGSVHVIVVDAEPAPLAEPKKDAIADPPSYMDRPDYRVKMPAASQVIVISPPLGDVGRPEMPVSR